MHGLINNQTKTQTNQTKNQAQTQTNTEITRKTQTRSAQLRSLRSLYSDHHIVRASNPICCSANTVARYRVIATEPDKTHPQSSSLMSYLASAVSKGQEGEEGGGEGRKLTARVHGSLSVQCVFVRISSSVFLSVV